SARELLARLAPALLPERPAVPERPAPPGDRVLVAGSGPIAAAIAEVLRERGLLAPAAEERPALAVLVADWVLAPDAAATGLRRDVAHLPVVASDRSVVVGPFVDPGRGPCVHCLQLAHRDDDPAWPAIASQLWGSTPPPRSRLGVL